MITIKDVAKRAGVSIAAVSYALNDKEGVNEETKRRVKQIAEELGYVPNSLAQGLLLKKTNIIGVVIPDISNIYTSNFIKYLGVYARRNGYFLLLGTLSDSPEGEIDIFNELIGKNVDSFIITPGSYDEIVYKEIVSKLNKRSIPFLFACLNFPNIKSNYVIPDLEEGEYQITKHLLEQGFRDLAFVGGKRSNYMSEIRYQGFLRALCEYDVIHKEERYIECGSEFGFWEGYNIIKEYVNKFKLPEVFVALNDSIAYGIIKGLREQNIRVPEDVCIVGFDDIEMPTIDTIPLTTVHIPIEEMAKLCIDILKETGNKKVFKQFLVPTEVVIRESAKRK